MSDCCLRDPYAANFSIYLYFGGLPRCYSQTVEVVSDPPSFDRRARPRVSVAIELKLRAPEHRYQIMSSTVDLSTHGAFVRTSRTLPVGAPVTVAFNRGSERNPLMFEAEVVRAGLADGGRQQGMALRFKDVSDMEESLLSELIDRHRS